MKVTDLRYFGDLIGTNQNELSRLVDFNCFDNT